MNNKQRYRKIAEDGRFRPTEGVKLSGDQNQAERVRTLDEDREL